MQYLQVLWQCQQRSIHLTLINASAVPHTLHPQAFHVGGGCDDVGAHVGRAAPVGKQRRNHGSHKPQQAQEEAEELNRHAGHDCFSRTDAQTAKYKETVTADEHGHTPGDNLGKKSCGCQSPVSGIYTEVKKIMI